MHECVDIKEKYMRKNIFSRIKEENYFRKEFTSLCCYIHIIFKYFMVVDKTIKGLARVSRESYAQQVLYLCSQIF